MSLRLSVRMTFAALAGALLLSALPATAQCPTGWTAGKVGRIKYQYWTPKNYNPATKYPLAIVFHGAGGIGSNNNGCYEIESTVLTEDSNLTKRPCFILAPKCTTFEDRWVTIHFTGDTLYSIDKVPMAQSLKDAMKAVDTLVRKFSIDTTRLYLMGGSLGAYAQWDLLARFPRKFAAAYPISGGCDTSKAMLIRQVPVHITHSDNDATVPPGGSRAMYAALRKAGGNPFYKEFHNYGHLWQFDLAEGRQYIPWLFAQSLKFDNTPPASPTNLNASYAAGQGVTLTWSAVTDAESGVLSYRIFRAGKWIKTVYTATCRDSTVQANTQYEYTVTTVNGAGLESDPPSLLAINTGTGVVSIREGPAPRAGNMRLSSPRTAMAGQGVRIRANGGFYDIFGRDCGRAAAGSGRLRAATMTR